MASEEIEDGALHGDECGFEIWEDAVGGVFEALRRFRTHSRGERVRGAALASSDAVDAARVGGIDEFVGGDVRDVRRCDAFAQRFV